MNRITLTIFSMLGLIVVAVAAVVGYVWSLTRPVAPDNTQLQEIVIPRGASVVSIADRLQESGLIQSQLAFRIAVKQLGIEGNLQAGTFELSPAMTSYELARSLTEGTRDVWITLLEGWRMEQIAAYLDNQELVLFDREEFEQLAVDDDGYLFPETYLIPKASTAQDVHQLLRDTFDERVLQGLDEEFSASERSQQDIITMASIVEREARDYEQMRHVAGILWNRIDIGMALQVDATLQYITGYNNRQETWWEQPSPAAKEIDSAYNTYQNPGLPPGPIANPSLQAVRATLDPLESDELFYLHDTQGNMYYAETLQGHNRNIDQYLR